MGGFKVSCFVVILLNPVNGYLNLVYLAMSHYIDGLVCHQIGVAYNLLIGDILVGLGTYPIIDSLYGVLHQKGLPSVPCQRDMLDIVLFVDILNKLVNDFRCHGLWVLFGFEAIGAFKIAAGGRGYYQYHRVV